MKIKLWHEVEKVMYWNAETIVDGYWHIGRLLQNNNIKPCYGLSVYDKNNVEIYTNDIIKYKNELYRVIYKDLKFIGINDNNSIEMSLLSDYNQFEVIGNYYEINFKG